MSLLTGLILTTQACSYKNVVEANYPDQSIYMTTAAAAIKAPGATGYYTIASVAVPGQTFRYLIDVPGKRLTIPLGIGRSGVYISGKPSVTISLRTDTLTTLNANGLLPTGTDLLPAEKLTIPPTTILDGSPMSTSFAAGIDLDFLLANPGKKYAFAVQIASADIKVEPALNTTLVIVDTRILTPIADFTLVVDASSTKKVNVTNASQYGVSYVWDFGDGTPTVTDAATSHTYAAPGTYTITLSTTGVTGSVVKKTLVINVV